MSTEEEFYKTFDIKKINFYECDWSGYCPYDNLPCKKCSYYKVYKKDYPPITDRMLLELVCILNKHLSKLDEFYIPTNVKKVKNQVLYWLVEDCATDDKVRQKVRKLFKEERC